MFTTLLLFIPSFPAFPWGSSPFCVKFSLHHVPVGGCWLQTLCLPIFQSLRFTLISKDSYARYNMRGRQVFPHIETITPRLSISHLSLPRS